ncbi:mini-chromosome maintenance complex-binding protein [Iris pallida]|uniref:Mini-chromosome maintenance complex-binding protein n=1 Tax=Iris pallida TaxID=29817 RepID=A0AAX6EQG1_IRIPA|nr:mini-chromosome maintenance complex-binding protein [Iris pallida]KAJ6831114.1 mini-chromosome maintenance complex-binding protein [Iris pallida]KAJ6831115.1 mini-chromosome maintenance complex-binding protein [Iris pallida]
MVGPMYDFLQNPLGAVRLSFDKAMEAAPSQSAADRPAAFNGKDWGAVDLFNKFLFEEGGLAQVPILEPSNIRWLKPNSLVRFRGMVQDMFGNELYVGTFKDGSTWRTNKFTDVASFPMPSTCETHLWERRLVHCIPVPGQNSWTLLESNINQNYRTICDNGTSQHGEKRQRDEDLYNVDLNVSNHARESPSYNKKQKEDGYPCQSSHLSEDAMSRMSEPTSDVDNIDKTSFSCLVKIYDMPESNLKLNDVFEFIGIYTFDPQLAVNKDDNDDPMYDLMEDVLDQLPPSKVPRLHCLICRKLDVQDFIPKFPGVESLPRMVRGIRESLLGHLTEVLGNDGLAAQCVLLHLLSKLRARSDWLTVGSLSLNLTSFTTESASIFGNQLIKTIQSLLPFSQALPLTIEYLNTETLQPRKNNQTGRLVSSALQLAPGTHLTMDETSLQDGALNSNGVENVRLLKHLMNWQKVEYDFEYYKLEMAADVQMLVLSEGKSNILPADLVLPFLPTTVTCNVTASAEELQAWRWYLATLRSLPYSNGPEMLQTVQDEMVAAMKEDRSVGGADLNRWLTMAQLVSASFGENSLSLERWQMVKELERLIKERLK